MIAALLFLSLPTVPVGAYGMPELCHLLSTTTGTPHSVDGSLGDYPVFVSVKSGDPTRVRQLVAGALHAQWVEANGGLRLRTVRPARDEDYAEFERSYKAACKGNNLFLQLPIHDLFRLSPGEMIRLGPAPTSYIQQMSPALAKVWGEDNPHKPLTLLRMGPGLFQHGVGDGQFQFSGLPKPVADLLGADRSKTPLSTDQLAEVAKAVANPTTMKIDWKNIEKRDPMASMQELVLMPTAKSMSADLVMALPDFSMFALLSPPGASPTVESILGSYSLCLTWTTLDSAVVGRIMQCEVENPSQAKRSVLQKVLSSVGKNGVIDVSVLSEYVADQRPAASDSWMDVMLLVMAGLVLDEEFAGDYPQNMRLYVRFDKDDWAKLKSGQPFLASDLSAHARTELLNLLVQSRSAMEDDKTDPTTWQTLDLSQLTVKATLEEKPILIGFATIGGEVGDVQLCADNYERRRKELGHEPLYQPASRSKLELTISSPAPEDTVTTGFSIVRLGNTKAVAWRDLPPAIAAEFKKDIEATHRRQDTGDGKPPP